MLVWPSVPPEFCKDGAKLILGLQTVNTCLKKTNKPSNTVSAGDLCGWHSLRLCSSHGLELITVLKKEEKKEQAFLSALLHVDGSCVPACPPFLYTPTLCSNKGTVNHMGERADSTSLRRTFSLFQTLAAVRDYVDNCSQGLELIGSELFSFLSTVERS